MEEKCKERAKWPNERKEGFVVDYILYLYRLPPAFDWLQLRAIEAIGWGKAKNTGRGAGATGATGATEEA